MSYKVHRFELRMTKDEDKLELFLNSLDGEIVAIIPNVTPVPVTLHAEVDFLLIVEKLPEVSVGTAPKKVGAVVDY